MSIGSMWRYLLYWIMGNAILYMIARESLPIREWFNLTVFVSCLTFLTFLEPQHLPEIPPEEPKNVKPNIKAAKVQGHVSGQPDGVHPEVPK